MMFAMACDCYGFLNLIPTKNLVAVNRFGSLRIQRKCDTRTSNKRISLITMSFNPLQAYLSSLELHPLRTKVLTAGALAMMGDFLAQQISARRIVKAKEVLEREGKERPDRHGKSGVIDVSKWDRKRTMTFALFGCLYTGFFQHNWFRLLSELGNTLPYGSSIWVAVTKLALNQFCMIPAVYFPVFYLVRGKMLRGDSLKQVVHSARKEYWRNLRLNWTLWVPVQFIMFTMIDEKYQVPFCCMVALLWNTILSFVSMHRAAKETMAEKVEGEELMKPILNPNLVFLKPSHVSETYSPNPLIPIKPAAKTPYLSHTSFGSRQRESA